MTLRVTVQNPLDVIGQGTHLACGMPSKLGKRQLSHAIKQAGRETEPVSAAALQCRRKFVRFFPAGFTDEKYIQWERDYKWQAHQRWNEELNPEEYRRLLAQGHYIEIADRAIKIESRTNLLFSFEKMAIRDAVKSIKGACSFAWGLYDLLHGEGSDQERFECWLSVLFALPRRKTRVSTWPLATVFGFIAMPSEYIFLKPTVTAVAAKKYGFDFKYEPTLSWDVYKSLLNFAEMVRRDLKDLWPKDMIDIQSFIWVQGSDEYSE